MINQVISALFTGWTLTLRSIRLEIREHVLGYAWTLITPMLYAFCYIFIKRELAGSAETHSTSAGWDALRAFSGITLVQCWMHVVQEMAAMVRSQKNMLKGLNVGPTPFVFAIIFESIFTVVIRSILIIVAVPLLGLPLPSTIEAWIWFLISVAVIQLTAAAIGLLLAPWATLYGDIAKALSAINLPLVLISPIFYPAVQRVDSPLYWINLVNPIASPLAVLADCLAGKPWSMYSLSLLAWGGLALTVIAWSIGKLQYQVPILLERMG
ncbi:MAG TPA: ABC transporter permease, partial [Spongiibacteraceae bacterium]|nr:ABC transporter permease [Spongiibacteraceae bacterium]